MAKYTYASPKRRINYKGIAAVLVGAAIISLGAITARGYFITKDIKKAEASIEQVENDKIKLQEELKVLEDEVKILETEAESLEEILWRYEPVIIPDSMKKK